MTVLVGDCRWYMHRMAGPVDAIVTDPPYELGFMGKAWDRRGLAFDPATWNACYRVLKPGGRLLAFGAPRTHHRIWTAIEDAGFTIEDTVMWIFGQGFPKHKSKLKPAFEPVCVARKGPVTALNIDAARIGFRNLVDERESKDKNRHSDFGSGVRQNVVYHRVKQPRTNYEASGRWPANVALDDCSAAALDAQSGMSSERNRILNRNGIRRMDGWGLDGESKGTIFGDSGGASRFFYVAKASRAERERGLESAETGPPMGGYRTAGLSDPRMDRPQQRNPTRNPHPCVKPLALMRWLVRLVTEPGDVVLDPFMGSGTTGMACRAEGRRFVGIELDPEYAEIARRRIDATEHDGQQALPFGAS